MQLHLKCPHNNFTKSIVYLVTQSLRIANNCLNIRNKHIIVPFHNIIKIQINNNKSHAMN